jgi:redox-sensing transcriptional repressor
LSALLQLRNAGHSTVSSASLGELTDINPAQIRRDLAYFGYLGRRGIGYDVAALVDRVQHILGSDHTHRLVLVGAGNLGSAIVRYDGLRNHGFLVTAVFDSDPKKAGTKVGDVIVRSMDELAMRIAEQDIRIGVVAVPPDAAQEVTDRLAAAGVRIILNYTPSLVRVPEGVVLYNTDPVRELLHTLYYMSRRESGAKP